MEPCTGQTLVSLSELLRSMDEADILSIFDRYRAIYESATETFLREKAIEMEKRDLSRTYLLMTSDLRDVLGYVTVSIKCMIVPEDNLLSGKARSRINVEAGTGIMQSYLLGQLSRSADAPSGMGSTLLDVAFRKLDVAKGAVGCRTVRLDCYDELIPYYEKHGFRLIRKNESGSLNQMIAFIPSNKG